MIGFSVFCTRFGYQLEIENICTAVDCFLNGCTVDEILNQSLFHDNHIVIDSPRALDGHAIVQIAANRLDFTIGLNHQEVVHIFNPNPLNIIDLKLELRFCFPSVGDFVHESQFRFVDGVHQTIGIKVQELYRLTGVQQTHGKNGEEQLSRYSQRAGREWVIQVVVAVFLRAGHGIER